MIIDLILAIFSVISFCYLANAFYFSGAKCRSRKRLNGKTAVITGAQTGIGFETALEFAKRGVHVIMACIDFKEGQKAAEKITQLTGNTKIEVEFIDLADINTIRHFAKKIHSKIDRLDILVNNSGVFACPYWKTKQGFEMQFGVNHLGHFLLTNLLLDLLKKSVDARVITVASVAHYGTIRWDDLNWERKYNPFRAYFQSKLANILFTKELAERLKGTSVTAVCVHPGAVRSGILRHTDQTIVPLFPYLVNLFYILYFMTTKSCYQGAMTTVHCAVSEDIPSFNGYYFSDCKPKKPSKNARNRQDAARLWDVSSKMVGL